MVAYLHADRPSLCICLSAAQMRTQTGAWVRQQGTGTATMNIQSFLVLSLAFKSINNATAFFITKGERQFWSSLFGSVLNCCECTAAMDGTAGGFFLQFMVWGEVFWGCIEVTLLIS